MGPFEMMSQRLGSVGKSLERQSVRAMQQSQTFEAEMLAREAASRYNFDHQYGSPSQYSMPYKVQVQVPSKEINLYRDRGEHQYFKKRIREDLCQELAKTLLRNADFTSYENLDFNETVTFTASLGLPTPDKDKQLLLEEIDKLHQENLHLKNKLKSLEKQPLLNYEN